MNPTQWADVDEYIASMLIPSDPVLEAALQASAEAGLPPHNVSAAQGKFLALQVRALGAKRVLEVGTLGGYSSIWMARALPEGGRLITLEGNPKHVEVAESNIRRAELEGVVDVRLGVAAETLAQLVAGSADPFDFVFIDADKVNNTVYLARAIELTRPGGVIIIDNVVRSGAVLESESTDANVQGVRQLNEMLANDARVIATEVQTVGSKGYDGFAFIWVKE